MDKIEQKIIGTVEPIESDSKRGFIRGAILKYGNDLSYHDSLLEYVLKMINSK